MVSVKDRDAKTVQFVNPEYVTSITEKKFNGNGWREVWVVGHAGYGTFSICTDESALDLATRLQNGG